MRNLCSYSVTHTKACAAKSESQLGKTEFSVHGNFEKFEDISTEPDEAGQINAKNSTAYTAEIETRLK